MQRQAFKLGLVFVCLLSACDGSDLRQTKSVEAGDSQTSVTRLPQQASSVYYQASPCPSGFLYNGPAPGSVFDYQVAESSLGDPAGLVIRHTISSSSNARVSYGESILSAGGEPTPADGYAMIAAVLPAMGPGRSLRYEAPDLDALSRLGPGQTATYKMTETLTRGPATRAHTGEVRVTLDGCGRTTEKVPGARNEPVHIYRVVIPFLTPDSPEASAVEMEWVIADRFGWKVVERSASATSVLVSKQA